jgi:gliding motility-associated-like protein
LFRKLRLLLFLVLASFYSAHAQVPVASITAISDSGCAVLASSFSAVIVSGNGPFTYSWSLPGAIPSSSTLPNVAVAYNTAGTYTVSLTVSNASGNSQVVTHKVVVNPVPVAKFTEDKQTGCYPTWINFTNLTTHGPGETITSYLWNFGDGYQDTVLSPSHRYTTGGNINVTLYVNNNFGCTGSAQVANIQKALTLNGGGIFPNFNYSLASSCNLPVTANFTNTTTGPPVVSYLWDFGDGGGFSNNIASPSHSYTAAANYTVRLAATSTLGCSDTLNLPINITANGNLTDFSYPDTNCFNTNVNFKNISSPRPISATWDYGDGTVITTPGDGQHTYTTPGTYTVTLTNTFAGCTGTVSKKIYIVNPPVASFTGTNLNNCKAPLTSSFTNTSTGATSYTWNFGDGFQSNLQNPPPHTYNALGSFVVTLDASAGSGCSASAAPVTVTIQQPTVALNNPLSYFGCAPYTFTPTATITAVDGVATYSWNFGNGNTANTATAPPQTYGAGSWTITLTITTNGGCTATTSAVLLVGSSKPSPVNFSFVPPSACVATAVQFTSVSPSSANKWFWDFGDGNVDNTNNPNPSYSYLKPGTFNVQLTEYNNGCWDTISHAIVVNPPLAGFKISPVCGTTDQFTFTDASLGPVTTYLWNFGDGFTSNSSGPVTHTYPVGPPKSYNVTLTASTGTCTNTSPAQTVNANQGTVVTVSPNTVCVNSVILVSALAQGNIVSYQYEFGDGNSISGGNNVTGYTYTKPGTYIIKVVTTDINGCVDSSGVYTLAVGGPIVNFTAPPALSCNALTFTFKDLSTPSPAGSKIVNWFWDFGDGNTSNVQAPPAHTYSTAGTYTPNLTVTDNNGCTTSLDSPVSIIVSIPVAAFTVSADSSCPNAPNPLRFTNKSTGGFNPTYTWDFNDGDTSNAVSPIYAYSAVGSYNVVLKMNDAYGCTSISSPQNIFVGTPQASFTMSGNFSTCPPFNDVFTFTGSYAVSYDWDFTDGNGSVAKNPSNLFANAGSYNPYLIVTSPGGCTSQSAPQNVTVLGPSPTLTYSPIAGCDSLTVMFDATTTNVVSYVWNFGDGSKLDTTTGPINSHFYKPGGPYPPVVTVVDPSGCHVSKFGTNFITVDSIAKAQFKVDKSILCDSGTIKFTDTSQLAAGTVITNYIWDFGDGTMPSTGLLPSVTHNYPAVGTYIVTMSITTAGGCSSSFPMSITVAASPKIAINGLVNQCEPAVLTFTGNQLAPDPYGPLTWSWNFGNGQSAIGQNPNPVNYPKAGEYVVSLTATNTEGCSMMTDTTAPNHLFIYPIPAVNAGSDTTICLGTPLQLNASGAATTYNWLPPADPAATLSCLACVNPVANPVPNSTYFVVTGTSIYGCKANDTIQVTVNIPPTVNVNGPDSVCLGQGAQLTATGAAIYSWSPAEGLNNVNIGNPIATPDASQIGGLPSNVITYIVTGYDSKKCFSNVDSVHVTAFNYPVITLLPNATINVGSSYQINSSATTNIVSLNWTPSNTLSCSNCLTPLATPTKTTKYDLTATNDGGCSTTDSIRVQVICNGSNFFVPNSFSPNGDGINDRFIVNGVGLNVIPSITIYNRWGQIVFQKNNFAPNTPADAWDGTFNGQPAPSDVYIYTIQILCNNATLIPYHGNVTLIR